MQHLTEIFRRIRDAKLRLHPKKCVFAVERINYLEHILSPHGVAVDPEKVEVVRSYPRPTNVKEVRSVLGFFGYYRRFVKDFSKTAAPLHNLLRKEQDFVWTDECESAFQRLRSALISTPILAYPDMNKPFILTTDASTSAIGYILSQIGDDGKEHPVYFGGRALRSSEKNWSISEIEALSLVEAIKEYHHYLSHRKFTVFTDHTSLTWLQSIQQNNGSLLR